MRIVSLACSNTEIVAALGCAHMLVGVDSHSDYPDDVVEALPRVGPDLEIDIEAVAALEPDLVLATLTVPGHETVIEGLELAGLPHIAPAPESLEDVYRDILDIADRLGATERGQELVMRMRHELTGGAEDPSGPRLLIQWWPKPVIAPGAQSWADGVIRGAGARNALGHEELKSRPLEDSEVVELAPDAIVISWCGVHPDNYRPDVVLEKDAWKDVPAVAHGRVFCVPEAYLGRPGPRLLDGLAALRVVVAATASSPA